MDERLQQNQERWEMRVARDGREGPGPFVTTSGRAIDRLYGPTDVADLDYVRDIGNPGDYPFTRSVHPTGYRGKQWTIRMFAGFGSAEETNARYRYLLDHGETGLSVAFELTTSMTINSPAAVIWAMYIAAAEKRGVPRHLLGGTIQNDILKEYTAQNEFVFPPAPSMRLVVDTVEFGVRELPRWNTISVSGYHIREAGATAAQELAFTLAD